MKTVGMFTAFGCAEWAVRALENHLNICDEILVSIQAHDDCMVQFADDTYERIAIEFANDQRVKIIPKIAVRGNINTVKCVILNEMISYTEVGDILMLCDADEFYDENAVKEIKKTFNEDWDMLRIHDMFFMFNFDWYVKSSHGRFWRRKHGAQFYPTQNMQPKANKVKLILEDSPMHHYSMLQSTDRREAYWGSDSARSGVAIEWLNKIYKKWNPDATLDEIRGMAEENYCLTGNRGVWFNKGVTEEETQFLFRYKGEHPNEVEFSPFRHFPDFRIIK